MRWLAVLVVLGCGKGSEPAASSDRGSAALVGEAAGEASPATGEAAATPPAGEGEVVPAPAAPSAAGTDWRTEQLVPHEVPVDGLTVVLELPEGLPLDPRGPTEWDHPEERSGAPKVYVQTIEVERVDSLDKAKYFGTLDART